MFQALHFTLYEETEANVAVYYNPPQQLKTVRFVWRDSLCV